MSVKVSVVVKVVVSVESDEAVALWSLVVVDSLPVRASLSEMVVTVIVTVTVWVASQAASEVLGKIEVSMCELV